MAPVVAGFALLPLRDHARNTNVALLLTLVTVGISLEGGLVPGAVAGLVTALTYNVLFTRPYWSLRINDVDDVETVLLLVLIGGIAGALVSWGRRQQREAAHQEASARRIRRRAELVSGSETPGRLLQQARDELCDLLDVRTCLYEPGPQAATSLSSPTPASWCRGTRRRPGPGWRSPYVDPGESSATS